MLRFLAVRLVHAAAIVLVVATITFVLLHLAPGDPTRAITEAAGVPEDVAAQLRRNFGLDRPIPEQYVRYLANLARGDLGYSFAEHRPVAQAILERIPNTLVLALAGLLVAFGLGVPLGAWQAWHANRPADEVLSIVSLVAYSIPVFWLGLMLQLVFGVALGWLPVSGAVDAVTHVHLSAMGRVWDRLIHLPLPALTLGLIGAAVTARYQRAATMDVIVCDFVRTARGKGLAERVVLFRHALRNALLPIITLFGLSFPILLSGAVLVETVFSWPGMGRLAVSAIGTRDYHVVTGTAIIAAIMVVLGNLAADLLYRLADPRTREPA